MAYDFSKGSKTIRKVGFLNGVSGSKMRPTSPFSLESSKGLVAKYFDSTKESLSATRLLDQSPLNSGTRRTGEEGRCVDLNGINQAVRVTDNTALDITDNLTVCVWAKNDNSIPAIETIIGKYDYGSNDREFAIVLFPSKYIRVQIGKSSGTAGDILETAPLSNVDVWTHYAFTFTGGVVKIYINGVSVSYTGTTSTTSIYSSAADLTIGCQFNSGAIVTGWDGQNFDARIYAGDSTVLTAEQIAAIYEDSPNNIQFTGQSLRAHYKLDEQSGTTCYDSSGNGNHGTIENAVSNWSVTQDILSFQNQVGYNLSGAVYIPRDESDPSNDVLGNPLTYTGRRPNDFKLTGSNCVDLNGTNQAVRVADDPVYDWGIDLSGGAWVKNNSSDILLVPQCIFSKYDAFLNKREITFILDTSEKIIFVLGNAGGTSNTTETSNSAITTDQWNHIFFTYDAGIVKLYLNGVLIPSTSSSPHITSINNEDVDLMIGSNLNNTVLSNLWDGQIVDVRIYNRVLSASEIQSIYEDSTNLTDDANLVGRWKCQEGAGVICHDSSVNENHGTIENAASNWGVTQNLVHSNLLEGHSIYEHATNDPIRVPFGSNGQPLSLTPPAGYSKTSDNPAGDYHNDAETTIDFDPDSTPEMNNIYLESVFNGSTSNGYVTNDSVLNFTDNLTVSCWAKSDLTDITSSADTLVSMYEDTGNLEVWRMEISTDEKLRFQVGNSGGNGTTIETADSSYPIDTWTHYAATFDGGVVKLYVNGELQSSSESSAHATSLNGRSAPLVLGAYYWSGGGGSFQEWGGALRNIRVYKGDSSPLSNSQIVRDMIETRSQPRFEGQTVIASYDLVKDTLDRSGNSLNAQNNNISFTKKTVPASLDLGADLGEDGIVQKTVKFDSGEWGAVFDGSSYAIVKNREKLKIKEKPFSIECSVKTTDTGSNTILSKYQTSGNLRSYSLNIESGKIVFHSSSNGTAVVSSTGSDTINDGSWHKIKVVRESESGTSLKMYVDDVEDTGVGGSLASNFSENISNVAIGAYNTDATAANVFTGNIRELKVFTDDNIERASWELAKDTRDSSSNNYHGENNGITFLTPKQEYGYTVSDSTPLAKQDQYLKEYHKSRLFL